MVTITNPTSAIFENSQRWVYGILLLLRLLNAELTNLASRNPSGPAQGIEIDSRDFDGGLSQVCLVEPTPRFDIVAPLKAPLAC